MQATRALLHALAMFAVLVVPCLGQYRFLGTPGSMAEQNLLRHDDWHTPSSDLRGVVVGLRTGTSAHAGTDDHIYVGIIGRGGGREFPLDDRTVNDFEAGTNVTYLLGTVWDTTVADASPRRPYRSNPAEPNRDNDPGRNPISIEDIEYVYLRKQGGRNADDDDAYMLGEVEVTLYGSDPDKRVFRITDDIWLGVEFGLYVWIPQVTDATVPPPITTLVDSMGIVGRYSSLRLDSLDRPRIAYSDDTLHKVKYAAWDGTSWFVETIDDCRLHSEVSLALSEAGNPRVCYPIAGLAHGIRYAKRDAGEWAIEDVDMTEHAGVFNSLALTPSGDPRISQHRGGVGGGLFFSESTGGAWSTAPVLSTPAGQIVGPDCTLAIGSDGTPRIAFAQKEIGAADLPGSVQVATWAGGTWTVEEAESMAYHNHAGISIALGDGGIPMLSYSYHNHSLPERGRLQYAKKPADAWVLDTVVSGFTWGSAIALSTGGQSVISFYETPDPLSPGVSLKYAMWDGTAWVFHTVATWDVRWTAFGGLVPTSLAVDSSGRVHISYYDPVGADLRYYAQP